MNENQRDYIRANIGTMFYAIATATFGSLRGYATDTVTRALLEAGFVFSFGMCAINMFVVVMLLTKGKKQ